MNELLRGAISSRGGGGGHFTPVSYTTGAVEWHVRTAVHVLVVAAQAGGAVIYEYTLCVCACALGSLYVEKRLTEITRLLITLLQDVHKLPPSRTT